MWCYVTVMEYAVRYLILTLYVAFFTIGSTDGFVTAMERYGFPGLSAFDIVETGKLVREEIAKKDPEKAAAL